MAKQGGVGGFYGVIAGFGAICLIGTAVTEPWERGDYGPAIVLASVVVGIALAAGAGFAVWLFGVPWWNRRRREPEEP
ncbi:LapA family protein [Streptomyces sp. NPDC002817]|uniref:LapA family protein n=1 Tax=Streptomyces sp. NPDC088357 TaxID=3154655 RepID=UPI003437892C